MTMFVGLLTSIAFAQNSTFKVQGHERSDIDKSRLSKSTLIKAEDLSFSFDDIKFWVGKGSKKAALVIDWFDGKGTALVWGFRFDGEATGYDMVAAVAKADPRFLFLTHGTGSLGNTIAGLGYDVNKSGNQYLLHKGDVTPQYPEYGAVKTTAYDYDDWSSPDDTDHWKSGWYNGYWSYQVKDSQSDSFSYSGLGASSRILQDGSWDGWGYQDFSNPSTEGVVPAAPYVAALSALPDYKSYWSEMGKNATHMSTIDSKLARASDEISESWKIQISNSWISGGQPIIVNGNVYFAVNNVLQMVDAVTGTVLKEATLAGSCGFFSMIAYGEGKIFVPLGNGVLQAFNAETLEPLWKTEAKNGYQQICPVAYYDGYVYTGMWKGGKPATGTYYCVSAEDEDTRKSDEIKAYTWESDNTGFYWAGGTVVDDYIVFGGDAGVVQSRNRVTGELIDSYQIAPELSTSTIRCGLSYDTKARRMSFTGKEAQKLYSIKVNEDGTFDKSAVLSVDVSGQTTTIPTAFNGRLYVTSGTMTSSGGMDVYDATTLERLYSVDLGGISQSIPLLSTGYATAENGNTVYLYVCLNNANGSIVCVKDFEGNMNPIVQFTYNPSSIQYCTHSLVADENGVLYYKNDAKYLFALKSAPNEDIKVSGITFDNESISIAEEESKVLVATIVPANASNTIIDWSSSDTDVATVDAYGKVKGVLTGTTEIAATTRDGGIVAKLTVSVTPNSGISNAESTNITVYPNPFADYIIVNANVATKAVVYDLFGKIVAEVAVNEGPNKIDTYNFASGLYIIKCDNTVMKLIKK